MSRAGSAVRIAAALLAVGSAGAASLAAAVHLREPVYAGPVADGSWTGRTRGWFTVSGVYGAEFDKTRFASFTWTSGLTTWKSPRLPRATPTVIDIRLRSGRGPEMPPPEVIATVDGREVTRTTLTNELATLSLPVPVSGTDGVTVVLSVEPTFVPGPTDRRSLGAVIEEIALRPEGPGRIAVPWRTFSAAALAAMAVASMALICGTSLAVAMSGGTIAAAMHAWLLSLDAAFLGAFQARLLALAAGGLVAASAIAVVRRLWFRDAPYTEWPAAAFSVLAAVLAKLAFFGHPAATVGDSIFHVHRAQQVWAGHYFFTSVTPRPFFEFPYAVGLYVTAQPWAQVFATEAGRVLLLRGIATAVDGAVGFGCYLVARRVWRDRTTALVAALLLPFSRMSLQTLCTANLTNAFAQAVFSFAMLFAIWRAGGGSALISTAGFGLLLAYGFLSHFSTASVGLAIVTAVIVAIGFSDSAQARRARVWMAVGLVLASVVSYAVYYSHFHDVYRTTLQRVASREGEAASRSMVAAPGLKLERYLAASLDNFGPVTLGTAGMGVAVLIARRRRDVLTLASAGWLATLLGFAALGVVTAIEMRANLAAIPVVTLVAAVAIGSGLAHRGVVVRLLAALALCVCVGDGFLDWVMCLTGPR